jgi:hypothetical protein
MAAPSYAGLLTDERHEHTVGKIVRSGDCPRGWGVHELLRMGDDVRAGRIQQRGRREQVSRAQ